MLIFGCATELFLFVPLGPLVSPPQAVINGRMYQSTITGSNSGGVDDGDVSRGGFGCAGIVFLCNFKADICLYVYKFMHTIYTHVYLFIYI